MFPSFRGLQPPNDRQINSLYLLASTTTHTLTNSELGEKTNGHIIANMIGDARK